MKAHRGFLSIISAILAMLSSLLLASVLLTLTVALKEQQNMLWNRKMLGACQGYLAQEESQENFTFAVQEQLADDVRFQEVVLYDNGKESFRLWRARF